MLDFQLNENIDIDLSECILPEEGGRRGNKVQKIWTGEVNQPWQCMKLKELHEIPNFDLPSAHLYLLGFRNEDDIMISSGKDVREVVVIRYLGRFDRIRFRFWRDGSVVVKRQEFIA